MNCQLFQQQIFQPDLTFTAVHDLSLHAATCEQCAQQWNQYLLLEEATNQWAKQKLRADVTAAVLVRLETSQQPQPTLNGARTACTTSRVTIVPPAIAHHQTRKNFALLAVVAALLFMLITFSLPDANPFRTHFAVQPPQNPPTHRQLQIAQQQNQNPLQANSQQPDTQSVAKTVPELSTALRDASSAYLALAAEARTIIKQAGILLPKAPQQNGSAPALPKLDPDLNHQLQQQLEPLENQVDKTIQFLIETIPLEWYPTS